MKIGDIITVGYKQVDSRRVPITGRVVALSDEYIEVWTRDGLVLQRY